jgi:hypothetical protein
VSAPRDLAEKVGKVRKQLFGARVLDAALGFCGQCGRAMVRGPDGPICESEAKKAQHDQTIPAEARAFAETIFSDLDAEDADESDESLDSDLWEQIADAEEASEEAEENA